MIIWFIFYFWNIPIFDFLYSIWNPVCRIKFQCLVLDRKIEPESLECGMAKSYERKKSEELCFMLCYSCTICWNSHGLLLSARDTT